MEGQDCPECGLPYAEAIKRDETAPLWIASIVAILITVLGVPMAMCMCGHLDSIGFGFTIPGLAFAWWPFLIAKNPSIVPRVIAMVAAVIASLAFAKNVADVLWFGHSPLF